MNTTVRFKLEKETKGAVRYQEVDDTGQPKDFTTALIGTVYLRKAQLPDGHPLAIAVTVTSE